MISVLLPCSLLGWALPDLAGISRRFGHCGSQCRLSTFPRYIPNPLMSKTVDLYDDLPPSATTSSLAIGV
jgi:hypothetical protein